LFPSTRKKKLKAEVATNSYRREKERNKKEDRFMWSFMTQPGVTTAVVDFTNDLSLLGIGLMGLVALATGTIAYAAIRHSVAQRTTRAAQTVPTDQRDAA
jgi:hypothetical protein